jgi:hypothetical protein
MKLPDGEVGYRVCNADDIWKIILILIYDHHAFITQAAIAAGWYILDIRYKECDHQQEFSREFIWQYVLRT